MGERLCFEQTTVKRTHQLGRSASFFGAMRIDRTALRMETFLAYTGSRPPKGNSRPQVRLRPGYYSRSAAIT